MASIIKAQFGKAALHGGLEGAEALAGQLDCNAALLTTNCDLDSLRDPEKEPVPLEVVARRAKVRPWDPRSGVGEGRGGGRSGAPHAVPRVRGRRVPSTPSPAHAGCFPRIPSPNRPMALHVAEVLAEREAVPVQRRGGRRRAGRED